MHGSASSPASGPGELCRLVDLLFHALRMEFDVDAAVTVDLRRSDALNDEAADAVRHTAVTCLLHAQHLHSLCHPRTQAEVDEVFALISALDVLLVRLMNGYREESGAAHSLREVHSQLVDLSLRLPQPLLPAGDRQRDGS